ncbi:MAG: NUDIX hydrolase [Candidatus Woesearchaeota archaeon]
MQKTYEKARIAVDAIIFTIQNKSLKVLLHTREKEPFKNNKELPGGLIQNNETAEETLKRKLKETIGKENIFFQQFFTFTSPLRDPRERTISIGYIALINANNILESEYWFDCYDLPKLAFDHKNMIEEAQKYLKENVSSLVAKQFLPEKFPLNKLQEVYEIIEEKKYDNRNFRKRILNTELIKETKEIEINVSHRPAKLYTFKKLN